MNGIIDAHVHVWTPNLKEYPLAPGFTPASITPPSFTLDELLEQAEANGVKRVHLIQMSFYGGDHRYLLDALRRYPKKFSGAGLLVPPEDGGEPPVEQARRMTDWGLRAMRVVGGSLRGRPGEWMGDRGYDDLFAFCAQSQLVPSFLVSPPDLPEIDRMCRRYPEAMVIVDHMARVGLDQTPVHAAADALCDLARHRRVYVKVGAFYALSLSGPPYHDLLPLIRQVIEAFGAQRCMWESDSPFQTLPPHDYAASISLLRGATVLSAQEKDHLLRNTAEAVLF